MRALIPLNTPNIEFVLHYRYGIASDSLTNSSASGFHLRKRNEIHSDMTRFFINCKSLIESDEVDIELFVSSDESLVPFRFEDYYHVDFLIFMVVLYSNIDVDITKERLAVFSGTFLFAL